MAQVRKIRGVPGIDQPREKLLKSGAGALSEKDLIALLIRSGVREKNVLQLAEEILKKYSLTELCSVSVDDLLAVKGIGVTAASSLVAAFELKKRIEAEQKSFKPVLDSPEKVYRYLSDLKTSKREKFVALYLNNRMRLIKRLFISVGTVSSSIVHPREVFKPAVELNASNVAVAHNHPSGDHLPSEEDVRITQKLQEAGEVMGIPVVDHIIISDNGYFSFKEKNIEPQEI